MSLKPFMDPLPIPKVLQPKSFIDGCPYYEVSMMEFQQSLHSQLNKTTVWGYEETYPGPIFEVFENQQIYVCWNNLLPIKHLLPVDKTVHGSGPDQPEVRTVVHVHGASVRPEYDGHPDAWFTREFQETGPFFSSKIYSYPNRQHAATLWYHDHALGITRLNVYVGLGGFYIIRHPQEQQFNLPQGRYEIPLMIQDRSFHSDGSLFYPVQPEEASTKLPYPSVVPEFFGDAILVNGKVWPYLEVEPRKYRFRIVNGSNARFYRMRLDTGQPFYQIGTDGGFLTAPVKVQELLLAPAERADVIVDFTGYKGGKITLTNDAPTPFPNGDSVRSETTGQIMQFRVSHTLRESDTSNIPYRLMPISKLMVTPSTTIRNLKLDESRDQFGRLIMLLDKKRWEDPVSENPRLGSTEVWQFINLTEDTHSIHLHLVQFQILGRQPFDVKEYQSHGKLKFTAHASSPAPDERGWKDTVRTNPGEVTRIIAHFTPYAGEYVWHCHLLEHEDHEMMRPYKVIKKTLENDNEIAIHFKNRKDGTVIWSTQVNQK